MGANFNLNSGRKAKRAVVSEINITPMVDVMLVLLIIFMVTSPLLVTGINVDLPDSSTNPLTINEEPLSVTIDAKGQVFIQDSQIELKNLATKLMAVTKEKTDTKIFVRGDKNVDYGAIMKVVSEVNKAGFHKVALVTEAEN